MKVGVPYSTISRCKTKDITLEVVDLMVHPLASIVGIQLYNFGGCRPYGPPSCLNYGQSSLIQQRLSNKNPIMLLCVIRFHSSLGREIMHYFTIHDLVNTWINNTLLAIDFGIWLHTFNNKTSSHTSFNSYLPLNLLNLWNALDY